MFYLHSLIASFPFSKERYLQQTQESVTFGSAYPRPCLLQALADNAHPPRSRTGASQCNQRLSGQSRFLPLQPDDLSPLTGIVFPKYRFSKIRGQISRFVTNPQTHRLQPKSTQPNGPHIELNLKRLKGGKFATMPVCQSARRSWPTRR